MTPQTRHQPASDPWHDKGERLWLIGALAFLACFIFAAYDGQGFHARYLRLCTEKPSSRECKPLNLVKEERPPELGVKLDFGKGKWALGVGPRQEEASANEIASHLRSLGVEPRVVRLPGRGKKAWYQVQVGRFPNRKNVNEAGAELQGRGIIQDFRSVEYQAAR
jgi:SPOR domain